MRDGNEVGSSNTKSRGKETHMNTNLSKSLTIDDSGNNFNDRRTGDHFNMPFRKTKSQSNHEDYIVQADKSRFQSDPGWKIHWTPGRWIRQVGESIPNNIRRRGATTFPSLPGQIHNTQALANFCGWAAM